MTSCSRSGPKGKVCAKRLFNKKKNCHAQMGIGNSFRLLFITFPLCQCCLSPPLHHPHRHPAQLPLPHRCRSGYPFFYHSSLPQQQQYLIILPTSIRMTTPPAEIIIKSLSLSPITRAAATGPVFSVTFKVITPLPPRL